MEQLSSHMQLIMFELEKMSKQQMKLMESMNSFQTFTREEVSSLKNKMSSLEDMVESMRRRESRRDAHSFSTEGGHEHAECGSTSSSNNKRGAA